VQLAPLFGTHYNRAIPFTSFSSFFGSTKAIPLEDSASEQAMKILILGGTLFLGRHLVNAALERGHSLTLFNRGRTNPQLFPQVETIHGDRKLSLDALGERHWDLVIDTSGYHPRDVLLSAETLADKVARYAFISTISVYSDFSAPNVDEDSPLSRLDDPDSAEVSNETYGALKTHCEDVVQAVYGSRALVIRPGLIVGPHDPTDRFTYWPVRAQRGGEILAPQGPTVPVQYIDVRDLAAWTVDAGCAGLAGIYNATGPAFRQEIGDFLNICRQIATVESTLTWVSPEFIEANQIAPFLDLPLWVPSEMAGLLAVDCRRALAAGLSFRPTDDTIQATLAWYSLLPQDSPLKAGLPPERETELLALWHQQAQERR
jgi:2'-hydroxyisoflavone reductase